MAKLLYQLHGRTRRAFEFSENMRWVAELKEKDKKKVLQLIAFVAEQKGPDLKQVLEDVREGAYPNKRIENDYAVEQEARDLLNELKHSVASQTQLNIFTDQYLEELRTRAHKAEVRAEQVRKAREAAEAAKKKEREEAIKGGALPFPQAQ
jgi:hypothetical protein